MTKAELRKAERALKTAKMNLDGGDTAASVNRSYYAMYYAARAMFANAGAGIPKTHAALIEEFSRRFVESGLLPKNLGRDFNKVEEQRRYVDYIADEEISRHAASELLGKASAFVDAVTAHLSRQAGSGSGKPSE